MKKTNKKNKAVSTLLVLILLFTVFAVVTPSVIGATSTYDFGGDWIPLSIGDTANYAGGLYKNGTNDYWYYFTQSNDFYTIQSTNGVDFTVRTPQFAVDGARGPTTANMNLVIYNNKIYGYFQSGDYWAAENTFMYSVISYDGSSWTSDPCPHELSYYGHGVPSHTHATGAKLIYYNGQWYLYANVVLNDDIYKTYLRFGTLDDPSDDTPTWTDTISSSEHNYDQWSFPKPCYAIYNGSLYLFYTKLLTSSTDNNIYYREYDGSAMGTETSLGFGDTYFVEGEDKKNTDVGGMGACLDYNNDQIILTYIDTNKDLVYRVSDDPENTWSSKYVITNTTGCDGSVIDHCEPWYIDGRVMVTFTSDARTSGTYKNYMMCAPAYTDIESGATDRFNSFSWSDASPGDTDINSSVIMLNNTGTRDIENITWHVGDIGDISTANNVKIWSNMSGSWASYQVGASQNTSEIDISADKAGGGEWTSGEKLYWKIEIESIDAGIAETTHIGDYDDIYYWVDLTPS